MARAPHYHALWAALALSAGTVACGASHPPADSLDEASDAAASSLLDASIDVTDDSDDGEAGDPMATSVQGSVLDLVTNQTLPDLNVTIGGSTAITDEYGHFVIPSAPGTYDAIIVDLDGTAVSVYRDLSRRDPVFLYRRSIVTNPETYSATVGGNVQGGGPFPIGYPDLGNIDFFSTLVAASTQLDAGGPAFGPLTVTWAGPSSVIGQLTALVTVATGDDGGYTSWFGASSVTLVDGQTASQEVELLQTPTAALSGSVDTPAGLALSGLEQFYRFPSVGGLLLLGSQEFPNSPFAYPVSDLTSFGASLCTRASSISATVNLTTERCNLTLPADIAIDLQAAPVLVGPPAGSTADPTTTFSWSAFDGGVYDLFLQSSAPSSDAPLVDVFTDKQSAQWPDLSSAGIPFPQGGGETTYSCSVGGLGPFNTIDDAVAPNGLGASAPDELRKSYGAPVALTLPQ